MNPNDLANGLVVGLLLDRRVDAARQWADGRHPALKAPTVCV